MQVDAPAELSTGSRRTWRSGSVGAGLAVALLVAVLWGGGVHDGVWSVVTVCVLATVGIGAWRGELEIHARALAWLAVGVCLAWSPLLYVLPLPLNWIERWDLAGLSLAAPWLRELGVEQQPLSWWPAQTWRALARALVMVTAMVVGATVATSHRRLQLMMRLMTLIAAFGSIIAIGQRMGFVPLGRGWAGFVNVNHGGYFAASLVPIALMSASLASRSVTQRAQGIVGVLLVCGVVASGSRGAMSLLVIGPLIYLFWTWSQPIHRLAGASLAVLALGSVGKSAAAFVGVLFEEDRSDGLSGRGFLWDDAWSLIQVSWPFGVGPGAYGEGYRVVKSSPTFGLAAHAHQDSLQLLAEFGVVGVVVLLWLLVPLLGLLLAKPESRRTKRLQAGTATALLTLVIAGMVDFPAHIGVLQLWGAVLLGVSATLVGGGAAPLRRSWVLAGFAALLLAASLAIQVVRPWHVTTALTVSEALTRRPFHHGTMMQEAVAAKKLGDRDRTVVWLSRVTQVYPTWPYGWLGLARQARAEGRVDDEAEAWAKLLALYGPSGRVHEPWVEEAFQTSQDRTLWALRVLGDDGRLWCHVAASTVATAPRDEAEPLLVMATSFDPSCTVYYATRLVRWGDHGAALALLEEFPDNCPVLRARATAMEPKATAKESLGAWSAALDACGPADRLVRFNIALARARTGDQRALATLVALAEQENTASAWRALVIGATTLGSVQHERAALESLERLGVLTKREQERLGQLRSDRR